MIGQVVLLYVGVELSWRWTAYANENLGGTNEEHCDVANQLTQSRNTSKHRPLTLSLRSSAAVETKNAAVATFGFYACVVPLLGRVMQGSAETIFESVIYEVAGTIAELFLADSFLKSKVRNCEERSDELGTLSREHVVYERGLMVYEIFASLLVK